MVRVADDRDACTVMPRMLCSAFAVCPHRQTEDAAPHRARPVGWERGIREIRSRWCLWAGAGHGTLTCWWQEEACDTEARKELDQMISCGIGDRRLRAAPRPQIQDSAVARRAGRGAETANDRQSSLSTSSVPIALERAGLEVGTRGIFNRL